MASLSAVVSKYIRPYLLLIILIIIVIILIVVAVLYLRQRNEQEKKKRFSDVANANRRNTEAEVLFFNVSWCPHCKTAKPEWEKFKNDYQNQLVNDYKLNLIDVNCTSELGESGQLIKTYDVEGFPTVKANANGKIINFDAKVTNENLNLFVKKML